MMINCQHIADYIDISYERDMIHYAYFKLVRVKLSLVEMAETLAKGVSSGG